MKILVACEISGKVRDAFRNKGHDAYSCDILPNDTNKYHIQGDAVEVMNNNHWDLVIAHPPCTYLTVSGARWFYHPDDKHLPVRDRRVHPLHPNRKQDQFAAYKFFMRFVEYAEKTGTKMCIENPIGVMSNLYKKPTQIIQPYQFGDKVSKATCLWLFGLPKLVPTNIVEPEVAFTKSGKKHCPWFSNNKKLRSVTFDGIANAMAEQWEHK